MKKHLLSALLVAAVTPAFAAPLMLPEGFLYDLNDETKTAKLSMVTQAFTATELVIPATVSKDGVEYAVTEVGAGACQNKTTITSIAVGDNVEVIGKQAFYGCTAVETVTLPESLRTIGEMAFYGDQVLTDVALPEGLESIENFAFYNCKKISKVTLPSTVTTLGGNPWGGCTSLSALAVAEGSESFTAVNDVLFDKDVTRLISAPCQSTKMLNYVMPETVKIVANNSMRNNVMLRNMTLSPVLELIEAGAFYGDNNLSGVKFSATLDSIGNNAFAGCSRLATIEVAEDNAKFKSDNNCLYTKDGKRLFIAGSALTEFTAPDELESIDAFAFSQKSITTVNLNKVKTIGNSAFYQCKKLETVDFGTALETIGEMVFQDCSLLKSVKLPATMRTIGNQAFTRCTGVTELILNEGLESVGNNVFYTLTSLTEVTVPGSLKVTGVNCFGMCSSLESVVLKEGIETISNGSFLMCAALNGIELPSTLKSIETSAFQNSGIVEIVFPEALTTIGNAAFQNTFLQTVELPDNVESIGQFAFAHNKQLTSFKAGKGLVTIGNNAIYGNDILTDIELNEGLQTIAQNAFGQCFELKTLTIPSTVTSIGNTIFIQDDALETIVNKAVEPQALAGGLFINDALYEQVKLIVPWRSVKAYKEAAVWEKFANIEGSLVGAEATVTIKVFAGYEPVADAFVTFEGKEYFTDEAGSVSINDLVASDYYGKKVPFTVYKDGYEFYEGVADFTEDIDVFAIVDLVAAEATLTVKVMDGEDPVAGAVVTFLGKEYTSDENGDVKITEIEGPAVIGKTIAVTVTKDGYETYECEADFTETLDAYLVVELVNIQTGINDIMSNIDNGTIKAYDLNGRRVMRPESGQLYIINGKKVLIQR